jgi:hypothetical protein
MKNKFILILIALSFSFSVANARGSRSSRKSYSSKSYKSSSSSYGKRRGTGSSYRTTRVKGYYKKSGKYVNGYTKTKSDKVKSNNYSTKGNINNSTGKKGTKYLKNNEI